MKEDFNYNQQQNARAVKAGQVLSHDEPNLARVWGLPARDDEEEEGEASKPTAQNIAGALEDPSTGTNYVLSEAGERIANAAEVAVIPVNLASAGIEALSQEAQPAEDAHRDRLNRAFGLSDGVSALDVWKSKHGGLR